MKNIMKKSKSFIMGLIVGLMLTSAVFASSEYIQAKFTDFNLIINGKQKVLQTKPLVYNGTSYLPVREISNLLGYDVTYKSDTRTIILDSAKNTNNQSALSDEWISLSDLATNKNIRIIIGEYINISRDSILISIKLDEIQEDAIAKKYKTNDSQQISILKTNNTIFLLLSELKAIGILD